MTHSELYSDIQSAMLKAKAEGYHNTAEALINLATWFGNCEELFDRSYPQNPKAKKAEAL